MPPDAPDAVSLAWPIEIALALAREHLDQGRALRLVTQGHSMWPRLRDGQLVVVEPLVGPPRVGDVVLIATPSRLILHRVIRSDARAIITKGDAAPRDDGPIPRAAILGRLGRRWDDALCAAISRRSGRLGARALSLVRRATTLRARVDPV